MKTDIPEISSVCYFLGACFEAETDYVHTYTQMQVSQNDFRSSVENS